MYGPIPSKLKGCLERCITIISYDKKEGITTSFYFGKP